MQKTVLWKDHATRQLQDCAVDTDCGEQIRALLPELRKCHTSLRNRRHCGECTATVQRWRSPLHAILNSIDDCDQRGPRRRCGSVGGGQSAWWSWWRPERQAIADGTKLAVENGDDAIVAALLAAGASMDAIHDQGRTALAYAVASGHDGVVAALQQSWTGVPAVGRLRHRWQPGTCLYPQRARCRMWCDAAGETGVTLGVRRTADHGAVVPTPQTPAAAG